VRSVDVVTQEVQSLKQSMAAVSRDLQSVEQVSVLKWLYGMANALVMGLLLPIWMHMLQQVNQ
jgi:hypothetical protein